MKTLSVYYDYRYSPPTWNAFDALLAGELRRRELGLERVRFLTIAGPREGFRHDNLPPHGGAERTRWHKNIVEPMPRLLPSCGEPAIVVERAEAEADTGYKMGVGCALHGFATNGAAARAGIFPFRAPAPMTWHRPYVTITLRETGWHLSRQSDVNTWLEIAKAIGRCGFDVIIIRDAMKCREHLGLEGALYQASPVTSENAVARAEVYAGAAMNLGIANGPLWFAWFMGVPVLIFDLIHDDEPCANRHSYGWGGLKEGDRGFPNSAPHQRLVWGKATVGTVLEAFAEELADHA